MKISARFRKSLVGLSLLVLGAFSSPVWADAPWEAGKRYALIVGIDNYENESVTDLKCATSDAKLFRDTLVAKGGFPEDNIFLLSSKSTGEGSQPSLTNIVFRLEWLREMVGPGDTLVFYFAGHGVSMDSETFLLTQEADQRSKNTLMVSSLRGQILNDLLKETGAQNTLVLLDACRNDPTAGRGDANNTLNETLARGLVFKPKAAAAPGLERNTATVFACSEGERSWEWGDKNQGFFTYFLSEALASGAYDGKGEATLDSLVKYLRLKVNATAMRETNHGQTPMLKYEGPGADNWVLARTDAVNVPAPTLADVDRATLVAKLEKAELEAKKAKENQQKAESALALKQAEAEVKTYNDAVGAAKASGGDVAGAQKQLNVAQQSLEEARQGQSVDNERAAVAQVARNEVDHKLQAVELAKVAYFGNQASPEAAAAKEKLTQVEQQLVQLERDKKSAVERAVSAEVKLAKVQGELDTLVAELNANDMARWKGRPSRRIRRSDLWYIQVPGEEATELP